MFSQLGQDVWVREKLNDKRGGYFVEFGASDGIANSNTFDLQVQYGWRGLLAEPCRTSFQELRKNRHSEAVETVPWAVAAINGQALFRETPIAELSTIAGYGNDHLAGARDIFVAYPVMACTLQELLSKWNSPEEIDYLSIDTEGSELDILKAYDWSKSIKLITVEHNDEGNHRGYKQKIYDLLTSKGYVRDREVEYDDWYIKQ